MGRILVAEDDDANRLLLERLLARHHEVRVVADGMAALDTIFDFMPDLIVLDVMMPKMSGYDVCEKLKADDRTKDIPVIFITASHDVLRGFDVGGVDYLTKPVMSRELIARIRTHLDLRKARQELEEMRDQLEVRVEERTHELEHEVELRRIAEERLDFLASRDSVTRLWNRQTFQRDLERDSLLAGREDSTHFFIRVDVRNLDMTSRVLDGAAGDALLLHMAQLLTEMVGDRGTVGRLGGAHFGISLPNIKTVPARNLAQDIVCRAQKHGFFIWRGVAQPVEVSAAVVESEASMNAVELFGRAARSADEAKAGSVTEVLRGTMRTDQMRNLVLWGEKIREAAASNHFELYYQRIVPLGDIDEGEHLEILLRLRQDDKMVPPGVFLPWVEQLGYSRLVDEWVVDHTLAWLPDSDVGVCAINLSGQSLNDPSFHSDLLQKVKNIGSHASRLCFELTESVALVNLPLVSSFVGELQSLGAKVALDDFGAGFASYGYLQKLSTDYLKIDGQFVKDMCSNEINAALVRSMNEVGHATNQHTIAEYVEDDEIKEALRTLGVDFAQGYGVHKPEPLLV